jgi:hypothetical protein
MPDPFGIPTNRDPLRPVERRTNVWLLAAFAVVAFIGLGALFWYMQGADDRTAVNPETTVGSRTAADPPPLASPAPRTDPSAPRPTR